MQSVQFDSKEQLASSFGAASNAGHVPARARASAKDVQATTVEDEKTGAKPRGPISRAFRFARNAAIGLLVISAIPLGVVGWYGGRPVRDFSAGVNDRVQEANRLRPLMSAKDASITPMQAGVAFAALQAIRTTSEFPLRSPHAAPDLAWKRIPMTKEMFELRAPSSDGPSAQYVIEATRGGYSANEMAYLRAVAESPVWADFDRVANANSVDMIGGVFTLPFAKNASAFEMTTAHFSVLKSLAEAGVSRAAYYLAMKDEVRSEAALRSIVSFGFALIDNGHTTIDAVMGRMIVGIGRNGLEQFNMVTQRSVPADQDASYRPFEARPNEKARVETKQYRAQLLADANNAQLPQSLRYESLRTLSMRSCGSVSEMLFGPGDDVARAFSNAERTLPKSAADKAYLELLRELPSRPMTSEMARWPVDQFVFGAADIAAAITRTPRIAACTRMVVLGQ